VTVDRNVRAFAAAAAAVLAVVVFAGMLLLTGLAQALVVYGAVLAQVAVLVVHRRAVRRIGGVVDRRRHVPRFLAIWSGEAGLTFLWAGDGSTVSAVIYVLVGVVFAAVATVFLAYAGRADDEPAGPTDTRPLPVQVPDGSARDE
jgi:hypothetical protein